MASVGVRPVTAEDAERLATIHAASWRAAYRGVLSEAFLGEGLLDDRRALWRARLAPLPAAHFGFVVEVGVGAAEARQPVGFVFAFGAEDAAWGTLVENLHVLPEWQGHGLGRRLLAEAAREAVRRHPGLGLHLWVYEPNVSARAFYARLGGVEVERLTAQAPGGGSIIECRVAWVDPRGLVVG